MLPSYFAGVAAAWGRMASSQSPFRLIQSLRAICGRGYSGKAWPGFTCDVQGVVSGLSAGFQSAPQSERKPKSVRAIMSFIDLVVPAVTDRKSTRLNSSHL